MQIALWSNKCGNGVSTLASVLATMIAVKGNYKTLLAHPMIKDMALESYLLSQGERNRYSELGDSGADGLFRLIHNGRLESNVIKDYCFSLLSRSNLDFLYTDNVYEDQVQHHNNFSYLHHKAHDFYDVIVTDLNVSMDHPLFYKTLHEVDVLLVVAGQNRYEITNLMDLLRKEKDKLRDLGLHIQLIIHPFDQRSSLSLKQLVKPFNIKTPLSVSYDIGIKDACNRAKLLDYVLREISIDSQRMSPYFKNMDQLVDKVLTWCQEVEYV